MIKMKKMMFIPTEYIGLPDVPHMLDTGFLMTDLLAVQNTTTTMMMMKKKKKE